MTQCFVSKSTQKSSRRERESCCPEKQTRGNFWAKCAAMFWALQTEHVRDLQWHSGPNWITVYRVTSLRPALSHATNRHQNIKIKFYGTYSTDVHIPQKALQNCLYITYQSQAFGKKYNFKMRILRFSNRCRCWFIPRKWMHQIASKRRNPHTQRCSVIFEQIWIFCSGKHLELGEWNSEKLQMVTCHIRGHKFGRSGCSWHGLQRNSTARLGVDSSASQLTRDELLWTPLWAFGLHKVREIAWLSEELCDSQGELRCMESRQSVTREGQTGIRMYLEYLLNRTKFVKLSKICI
jgi:hypothetical protein